MKSWSYDTSKQHCIKSVRIRSYSGPHFPAFGLNTEFCISPYSVQMRENADQNNSEYGHFFCAVQYSSHIQHWWEFCSYWNANPFNASFNDNAEFRTQYFLRLECEYSVINLLRANPTRWSNTLKQFVGNFPTNCLIVFDHFVRLALRVNTAKSALSSIFPFDNVLTFGK